MQRCKAIVTGILLSAGEPRGEAIGGDAARALPRRGRRGLAADAARCRLDLPCDEFGATCAIASDAVLQQAVFNLLDNAAEVSPDGIDFARRATATQLVLTVRDRGPGLRAPSSSPISASPISEQGRSGAGSGCSWPATSRASSAARSPRATGRTAARR